MFPRVIIDLNKIKHNTKSLVELCKSRNISVMGVSKVFCAIPQVVDQMQLAKVEYIADSRVQNLERINTEIQKVLLRLPMISEATRVVKNVDISLNSEIETILELNNIAKEYSLIHKILLMVDLGDLREGVFYKKDIYKTVEKVLQLKNIKLVGIGVNFSCYGGVIADEKNLKKLVEISDSIKNKFNIDYPIISCGNSSSLYLIENEKIPQGINNIRLGESILLGRETAFGDRIKNTFDDCFILEAQIIELKKKPSYPIGNIGMDAFGNSPSIQDKGIMKRAILAIGKQDVDTSGLIPFDKNIEIIGASSDHLIMDTTKGNYKIGDIVKFKLNYSALLRLSTSQYVYKKLK